MVTYTSILPLKISDQTTAVMEHCLHQAGEPCNQYDCDNLTPRLWRWSAFYTTDSILEPSIWRVLKKNWVGRSNMEISHRLPFKHHLLSGSDTHFSNFTQLRPKRARTVTIYIINSFSQNRYNKSKLFALYVDDIVEWKMQWKSHL